MKDRWGPGMAAALLSIAPLLAPACGGDDGGFHTMGMMGVPSSAVIDANLILVDAVLNGFPGGRLLVDTGSPLTFLDPAQFPGATLPAMTQVTANIGIGGLTVDAVPALHTMTGTMSDLHLGGILGGNVTRQFSTEFNYRDQQLQLGVGDPPTDVEQPGAVVDFKLEGGGRGLAGTVTVTFPATRVPLTVTIDGVDHPFILDTGASEVTIRDTLFTQLTADGRGTLPGLLVGTATGVKSATASRARAIVVGGQLVTNVVMLTIGDDTLLDGLGDEIHHQVDGLLGGSYLREFLLTVDYPHGKLHLQRYANRAHIVDEFQRVGFMLVPSSTGAGAYRVGTVFAGSDAAVKGVHSGDVVVSIDGQSLTGVGSIAAEHLLQGTVGTTRRIEFGATSLPALTSATIDVRIDDLIPPPPPAN